MHMTCKCTKRKRRADADGRADGHARPGGYAPAGAGDEPNPPATPLTENRFVLCKRNAYGGREAVPEQTGTGARCRLRPGHQHFMCKRQGSKLRRVMLDLQASAFTAVPGHIRCASVNARSCAGSFWMCKRQRSQLCVGQGRPIKRPGLYGFT